MGDSLTTLALNYQWRKIIAIALQYWFSHGRDTLAMTNEDYFEALIQDLYTAEELGMLRTVRFADIPSNATRTSNLFGAVPGFNFGHTFTKSKAKISISNIRISVSGASNSGFIRATLNAGTRITSDSAQTKNPLIRDVRWSGLFENIPTGVQSIIGLEFAAAPAGTITMTSAGNMVIEIEEYD